MQVPDWVRPGVRQVWIQVATASSLRCGFRSAITSSTHPASGCSLIVFIQSFCLLSRGVTAFTAASAQSRGWHWSKMKITFRPGTRLSLGQRRHRAAEVGSLKHLGPWGSDGLIELEILQGAIGYQIPRERKGEFRQKHKGLEKTAQLLNKIQPRPRGDSNAPFSTVRACCYAHPSFCGFYASNFLQAHEILSKLMQCALQGHKMELAAQNAKALTGINWVNGDEKNCFIFTACMFGRLLRQFKIQSFCCWLRR